MSTLFESLRATPGSTRLSRDDPSAAGTGPMSAADWARRLSTAGVKVVVRELAGLDDVQLLRLARETSSRPTLPAPLSVRAAIAGGILVLVLGAAGLAAESFSVPELSKEMLGVAVAAIVLGALTAGLGWALSLRVVPAARAYETLKRYVAVLDEQHPWLYQAVEAVQGQTAEAYREHVLATRGPLRGLDVLMMQFAADAQAEVLQCMPARDAVQRLQKLPQVPLRTDAGRDPSIDLSAPAATIAAPSPPAAGD